MATRVAAQDDGVATTVRWDPPDPGSWALESAHGSELGSVGFGEIMAKTFSAGTRRGLAPFGLPLSHAEIHLINGWPYVSFFAHDVPRKAGKPPPDLVLKVVTRLHPGFRRRTKLARKALDDRLAQANAAEWFAERETWIARMLSVQRVDPDSLNSLELGDHLEDLVALVTSSLERHFELIFSCSPLGRWFVRCAEWNLPADITRAGVMHSTPVHEEARQRLARVAAALGDTPVASLDQIRSHSSQAAAALDEYLEHHGSWALADRARSLTLGERPEAIIRALNATRQAGHTSPDLGHLLEELRGSIPAADHQDFDTLARDAHEAYKMLDDNSGILGSWPAGILSLTLRHVAQRLHGAGLINNEEHLWALPMTSVLDLLRSGGPSAEKAEQMYDAWHAQSLLDPPRYLGAEPEDPPDPGVFPAPVADLTRSVLTFIDDKFNEQQTAVGLGDTAIRGRAIVAEHAADALERIEAGDILVTVATTPAFNTVLSIASGVIVTEGGLSSHTAVVARELGIPALLGVSDALDVVPDGAQIELDPKEARVTVLS